MDVKEIVIPALATVGGAGAGAGGAYAANSYFSGGENINLEEQFPNDCTKEVFGEIEQPQELRNKLEGDGGSKSDIWNTPFEAKSGCLMVRRIPKKDKALETVLFELTTIKADASEKSNQGVVIWSVLSMNKNNKADLVSRVLTLSKGDDSANKWSVQEGLEFQTKDIVLGDGSTGSDQVELKKIIKSDGAEIVWTDSKLSKFTWKIDSDTSKNTKLLTDRITIESGGKKALFFGRDLSTSNALAAVFTGVYKRENKGWKTPKPNDMLQTSIFKSDKKGFWS